MEKYSFPEFFSTRYSSLIVPKIGSISINTRLQNTKSNRQSSYGKTLDKSTTSKRHKGFRSFAMSITVLEPSQPQAHAPFSRNISVYSPSPQPASKMVKPWRDPNCFSAYPLQKVEYRLSPLTAAYIVAALSQFARLFCFMRSPSFKLKTHLLNGVVLKISTPDLYVDMGNGIDISIVDDPSSPMASTSTLRTVVENSWEKSPICFNAD